MYEKKPNEQLFTLVRRLSLYVPNDYAFGTILGYSVIDSLRDFTMNNSSPEQVRFGEIKKVYEGIDGVITSYAKGSGCRTAKNMQGSVDEFFSRLKSDYDCSGKFDFKSSILERVLLSKIKKKTKNFGEAMMKSGLDIKYSVEHLGAFSRPYDYLNSDYNVIEEAFGIGDK